MTSEEATLELVEVVRKAVRSSNSGLRFSVRTVILQALKQFEDARSRKTGLQRILEDDGDDLPGAETATTTSTLPRCKFCERHFRARVGQKYCSTDCRRMAYNRRQARIKHKADPKPRKGHVVYGPDPRTSSRYNPDEADDDIPWDELIENV
jgi:hypothetical protein